MICKPICKYLLCVTVLCDQRMMSRCLHIENLAAFLSHPHPSYTRPSFPWQVVFARVYSINWQVFPWQVLFARVHNINWQVFPWQEALFKSWSCPAFEEGKLFVCTARQGKLSPFKQMCEHHRQGKLVQPYTRAKKTCQGKLAGKKSLFIVHTSK